MTCHQSVTVLWNLSLALFVMMSNMSECFKGRNNIQWNSFNLMSDNSEILIIWYLRRVVPRFLFVPEISFFNAMGRSQGHVQKASRSVQLLQLWRLWETQMMMLMNMRQHWRRNPSRILLWSVVQPKYRSCNKKLPARIEFSVVNIWYSIIWHLSGPVEVGLI